MHTHPSNSTNPCAPTLFPSPQAPPAVDSVLQLIGSTPMLKVSGFDTGVCELFLKLENCNPGAALTGTGAVAFGAATSLQGSKPRVAVKRVQHVV